MRNMYVIQNPTSADEISRIGRPTLTEFENFAADPIVGAWREDNVLNDMWLLVTGTTLWEYDGVNFDEVGSIPGTDYPIFASTSSRVIIVRDGIAYSYDGTTYNTVVMPDDALVSSVASINGYFIFTVKDTQRFYWTEPGETDPDPLSFAEAERTPDTLVCVKILGDELWFLGTKGVEVWQPTGDSDDPFVRIPARVYTESCADAASAVQVSYNSAPALCWVSREGAVILAQGSPSVVSNGAVEEKLRSASNLRAWTFKQLRNNFYVLTSASFTYVFDLNMNMWMRWDTYLKDYWRAHLGFQAGNVVYGFDSEAGIIWQLTEGEDDDGTPVVRELSGFVPNLGRPEPCYNVALFCNVGWLGTYEDEPTVELRWSDDNGTTFTPWIERNLGSIGQYKTDIWYRSLGQIKSPGRYFEFRYSGPGPFRLDFATYNEE
jgi:hypothetical protein